MSKPPSYVPRGAISWHIGRLHVSTSDEEITKDITERIKANNPTVTPRQIQACVNYALKHHHENQGLYKDVMSGNLKYKKRSVSNGND